MNKKILSQKRGSVLVIVPLVCFAIGFGGTFLGMRWRHREVRGVNVIADAPKIKQAKKPVAKKTPAPTATASPSITPGNQVKIAPTPKPTATPAPARTESPAVNVTSTPAPQKTMAATPAPVPSNPSAMVDLINQARAASGLSAVKTNSMLTAAALAKSKDMATKSYFSHTGPDGKSDFAFVTEAGYNYTAIGSNIAEGDFSGDRTVFEAWMGSPGHRENILASFGQEIGYAGYQGYYTLFIAKR